MELLDPTTGQALPEDAIQRVLFLSNAVHVYNIPPLTSTKGYNATSWTADPARHIFTARLRVIETSTDAPAAASGLKIDIVLEDGSTGQLFAAAPYTDRNALEPCLDSSRFFAMTVRDPSGRKAVLGIGFEERAEAFDLGVALQEARRALGWEGEQKPEAKDDAKDYSLKEGETITVDLGSSKMAKRRSQQQQVHDGSPSGPLDLQSFALAPPPSGGSSSGGLLPPPPSSQDIKIKKQRRQSAKDLGFDDGQFGEFA